MNTHETPALLCEMLKSFVSLARTLNLTDTVHELGSTRQTVRRHIALLEEYKGNDLFVLANRRYQLTEAGRHSLREANELLMRAGAWLHNESRKVDDLQYLAVQEAQIPYFMQQHPLSALWRSPCKLLPYGLQAWAAAQGALESPAVEAIRPYLIVFRHVPDIDDWICTEVGSKSSFATWHGWKHYRSAVGKSTRRLSSNQGLSSLISQPFQEVMVSRGMRYDHIHTQIPHGPDRNLTPVSFQRLTLAFHYPDGELALASLVVRTHDVHIMNLPEDIRLSMPKELAMAPEFPAKADL